MDTKTETVSVTTPNFDPPTNSRNPEYSKAYWAARKARSKTRARKDCRACWGRGEATYVVGDDRLQRACHCTIKSHLKL